MKLTIATITARDMPHYEWLWADLAKQARAGDELEIIVIDLYERSAVELGLCTSSSMMPVYYSVITVPPKPNPWQGRYRVVSQDLHAIANARNTAAIAASHDYIAFIDDRAKIGSRWLDTVRRGAEIGRAICGPCDKKVFGDRVLDDRRERMPHGRPNCPGDWFYGGNFALPLAQLLAVNGCEEATDPVGRQDRILGKMLENNGYRIDFDVNMAVLLDRRVDPIHPLPRIRKGVPPANKSRAIMDRFGSLSRTSSATPDLRELRERYRSGQGFPNHSLSAGDPDWYDQKPIGTMGDF